MRLYTAGRSLGRVLGRSLGRVLGRVLGRTMRILPTDTNNPPHNGGGICLSAHIVCKKKFAPRVLLGSLNYRLCEL